MCIGSGECLHRCMLMSRTHNTHIQVHIHAHTTHTPHHNQFSTRLFSDFHQYLSQSWAETSELLGRISSSELDPQSFLLCLGLFCTFVYVRMYVSVCTAHVCIRVCAQHPHALAKYTKALGCNPLLPSPKSVRLWGVHRHRTGWRLVGVPFRSTLQTV